MHNEYNFQNACHGQLGETFHSKRGIRQDDPISPYTFFLHAKYLGRYIHFMSTMKNSGVEIKLTKYSPIISYLMSTDDCLIFCRATKQVVQVIKNILDHYTKVSRDLSTITNLKSNFLGICQLSQIESPQTGT